MTFTDEQLRAAAEMEVLAKFDANAYVSMADEGRARRIMVNTIFSELKKQARMVEWMKRSNHQADCTWSLEYRMPCDCGRDTIINEFNQRIKP